MSQPPAQPLGWFPDRYLWWWRASRVISDYDLSGGFKEIIDEFPFFSFLHADLHPHVLAIPFSLLAIAAALNLFLGGWHGELNICSDSVYVSICRVRFPWLAAGWIGLPQHLGYPHRGGVDCWGVCVWLGSGRAGWGWERGEDVFILGIPLGILSFLLYLPFYLGFSSQLGGILPNLVYPTRGAHLWVMLATCCCRYTLI